jgi:fumarate reductase subunit D
MATEKTTEPFWWGLFSVGGVVAAFLVPVHILLVGLALPLGWITDTGALYRIWWVKIYLFVLIVLPLYHWAHRFYFTLNDMGLKAMHKALAVLCYGGAILVTVITAWVLLRL